MGGKVERSGVITSSSRLLFKPLYQFCHDYQNFEQVVERVIEIDNDPNLYARYIQAPPTVLGNYYHDLVTKMRSEWKALITECLARRQTKRDWSYTHARLGWMVLSNLPTEIAQLRQALTPDFKIMLKSPPCA